LYIASYLIKKRNNSKDPYGISVRIRSGDENEIPFEMMGVKWLAYIPSRILEKDEYVWLKGPYCPDCFMDLEWRKSGNIFKNYQWYCSRCNKSFNRPTSSKYKTLKDVENICYADIFRKEKFKKNDEKR